MRRLTLLLVIVFAAKLTVALQLDKHPLLQPDTGLDTTAYAELAQRVVGGDIALGPGLYYVSPLYIYFLALVYGAAKSFTAARAVQAALGTVSVLFIFLAAREWYGRRAAWISAVLAGFTGVFAYYEALILQSSIDAFLTAAALWLLSKRRMLFAGIVFGLASLNRPNMFIAALAVVAFLAATRQLRAAGILAAGVLAGLAPVTIRNIVVAHQWSLVSSHGGINFYIGNGEGATGYFHAVPGMPSTIEGLAFDAHRVAERSSGRRLTDAEVSSYFTHLALQWMREHPAAWLRVMMRKSYGLLNAAHVSTPFSYTFYAYDAHTLLLLLFIGPWLLVPLGIVGLLHPPRLPLAFTLGYAASVLLFFVTERYKLPLFVVLAIASGAGAEALRKRSNMLIAAALLVAVNWPLRLDDGRNEERMRMAEYEAGRGNVAEATRWIALTGTDNPRGEYALGRALLGSGRYGEAASHLRRATAIPLASYDLAVALQQSGDVAGAARVLRDANPPPDSPLEVWVQFGRRAAEVNAPDAAERFFRRATQVAPNDAREHQALGIVLMVQGRLQDAAAELAIALRLEPDNAEARKLLEMCGARASAREAR